MRDDISVIVAARSRRGAHMMLWRGTYSEGGQAAVSPPNSRAYARTQVRARYYSSCEAAVPWWEPHARSVREVRKARCLVCNKQGQCALYEISVHQPCACQTAFAM